MKYITDNATAVKIDTEYLIMRTPFKLTLVFSVDGISPLGAT